MVERVTGDAAAELVVTLPIIGDRDAPFCVRQTELVARVLGFGDREVWEIAIAVSELVNNAIMHAGRGTLRLGSLPSPCAGIEVVVEDEGPGIADIESALAGRDPGPRPVAGPGERARGLGYGLSAVRRLMDELTIENRPGGGLRARALKRRCAASEPR
jgi:serine/threonine-protein kinase RsbT